MDVDINQTAVVTRVDESGLGRRLGVAAGDVVLTVNDVVPRDILEWQRLVDEDRVTLRVSRHGETLTLASERVPGEATGITIESAVFDRVHTCDNHCEFCFIYQLPKGMRRSLYLKDDDYRLSFLFGNFTTLTRFTEADLERVLDEGLSPLFVSIHATDPWHRAEMLRNPRGGTSLRWLSQLIDRGIEVNGQIVLCPGVNDGDVLDGTMLGVLEQFPGLARVAVVPLGISKENTERRMRAMTVAEVSAVGLPAVYVPLPIGNGEQRLNALPVVEAGGGLLIADADLTPSYVGGEVVRVITDAPRLAAMTAAAAGVGHRDAARRIADIVLEVARTGRGARR